MSKVCLSTINKIFNKSENEINLELETNGIKTIKLKALTPIPNTAKKSSSNVEINQSKSALVSNSETILTKVQEFDSKAGQYDTCLHPPSSSKSLNFARDMEFYDFSKISVPNSTVCVVGSNPGEPKKNFNDQPPRKNLKNSKKRKDKRKVEQQVPRKGNNDTKMTRGIMKQETLETPGDCLADGHNSNNTLDVPDPETYALEFSTYSKRGNYKSVSFNSEVIIIHFIGDSKVEKTVQALCKEQDQQARNFEFRKRYFAKYNTFFP